MNEQARRQSLAALTLGAIGVVYGDIGTSPLYTMKEIFSPGVGVPLDAPHIVGAVSTIFWALMFVVTLKYVLLILRADNKGEGGIMALTALAVALGRAHAAAAAARCCSPACSAPPSSTATASSPRRSRCSARPRGSRSWRRRSSPGCCRSRSACCSACSSCSASAPQRVGVMFGPVIVLWFATLAATGAWQIAQAPAILQALDPRQAFAFLHGQGWHLFVAVGAIVLALTGAEALYADMGHFGPRPIRHRLARPGAAGAGDQLHGPGRAADARTRPRSRTRSSACSPRPG